MSDLIHPYDKGRFINLKFADMQDGTHAEQVVAAPPLDLLTDGGIGPNRRLRVDDGEADFFAGRKFRSYLPLVIPVAGPTVQARFTCAHNFILTLQELTLTQGAIQLQAYRTDGTPVVPSGSWTARPIVGVNRMSSIPQPPYVTTATFEYGGNFTGGDEVDLVQVRTTAQNVSAQNVEAKIEERGLAAGTYYLRFSTLAGGLAVNDAAQLIYRIEWMERP